MRLSAANGGTSSTRAAASQCDSDDDYDFIRRVNMVMNHCTELSKGSQGLLCSPIVIVILMVKLARYDYRKSCPIKCRRCLLACIGDSRRLAAHAATTILCIYYS